MAVHVKLLHANIATSDSIFTVNILDICNDSLNRKILEAYYIINFKPDLNKNTDLFLT